MPINAKSFLCCVAACSLLFFAGCKKGDGGGPAPNEYYFRAKLNGELKNFVHGGGGFNGAGNNNLLQHIILSGYESDFAPSTPLEELPPAFSLEIWNEGGNIPAGTYTEAEGLPSDSESPNDYSLDGEYHIQTNAGTIQYDAYDTHDFTMIITEISKEKGIKGTFKGKIANEDDMTDVVNVTEGEFYLPYGG